MISLLSFIMKFLRFPPTFLSSWALDEKIRFLQSVTARAIQFCRDVGRTHIRFQS